MEKLEQKFVIKFFFLKGLGSKEIHRKLTIVFGSTAYLLIQIREWRVRFKAGDLSCEDKFRFDRFPQVLGKALSDFLEEFPFATVGLIVQHFNQSKSTIKKILQRELGLQRFSKRQVSHSLSNAQKVNRTTMATDLLSVLQCQMNYYFSQIVTEDES
jgi:hypothetical protein